MRPSIWLSLSLACGILAACGGGGGATGAAPNAPPVNQGATTKLLDSFALGYSYGYAPTIVFEAGRFDMFYCSTGRDQSAWDYIRHTVSSDGHQWSFPSIVLTPINPSLERAACDPSLVYFEGAEGPFYYLFYAGNRQNMGTAMFVARSSTIDGPYFRWTDRLTWEPFPWDAQVIIRPQHPIPEEQLTTWYGAGQQTVVVKDGTLFAWYTDDTVDYPNTRIERILMTTATDPTQWAPAVPTNVVGASSVDVKYDEQTRSFIMFYIDPNHGWGSALLRRTSTDGITWSGPDVLCDATCFPHFAHNIGVSGDRQGHLLLNRALVAYGAPRNLTDMRWAHWDLYGSILNPGSPSWAGLVAVRLVSAGVF